MVRRVGDGTAREGAEGRENQLVLADPEAGEAEAGVPAVPDAGHGVEVAADREGAGGGVAGIVNDREAVERERLVSDDGPVRRERSGPQVVVAEDEVELAGEAANELREKTQDGGRHSLGGVQEVTGHHQSGRLVAFEEIEDASSVLPGVAFGDRDSTGAEGGGFAEVGVGEDEGFGEEDGFLREQGDFAAIEVDGHEIR